MTTSKTTISTIDRIAMIPVLQAAKSVGVTVTGIHGAATTRGSGTVIQAKQCILCDADGTAWACQLRFKLTDDGFDLVIHTASKEVRHSFRLAVRDDGEFRLERKGQDASEEKTGPSWF